jgi:hypothetical protein
VVLVFKREAREFQLFSHFHIFNYVTRILLTLLTHATKKSLEKQRSNANATKTFNYFHIFNYVTRISIAHATKKSLQKQRSNVNATKTRTPTLEHRYTPHRDAVELWRMRSGPRVDAIVHSFIYSKINARTQTHTPTGTKVLNALSSLYIECTRIFDKK